MTHICMINDDGSIPALVLRCATKSRGRAMANVHASWRGLCVRSFRQGRPLGILYSSKAVIDWSTSKHVRRQNHGVISIMHDHTVICECEYLH